MKWGYGADVLVRAYLLGQHIETLAPSTQEVITAAYQKA